jgi:hypothetical protein
VSGAPLRRILIVLLAAMAPAFNGQARPLHASALDCGLYTQLERRCGCGARDGYLLGYGRKYCERFLHSTGWSAAGLRWRDRTLSCLKDALARKLARSPRTCYCGTIRTFAFDSHVRCYTLQSASVCALPLSDIGKIYQVIDAGDLVDPAGVKQALGVTLSCVWQNRNAGARPDDPR